MSGPWIGRRWRRIDLWSTTPCCAFWRPRATRSGASRPVTPAAKEWLDTVRALGGGASIPALDLHEVIAGKLVALFDRRAARDLFDTRRILEIQTLDWCLIWSGVLAWGAAGRRDWRDASLDDIAGDPRELRQKLAVCLPRDFFDAAGGVDAWIADSVALCRAGLAPLFERSAGETAFLDRVLDTGEIDPSGLAVPDDVKTRIAAMPMLVWKTQNVRQHIQTHRG